MTGFGTEDFISFDFEGEAPTSGNVESLAGPSKSKPSGGSARSNGAHPPAKSRRRSPPADTSFASTDSKGKKRKFDDDEEDADGEGSFTNGMTKKEKERAAARGTPWSVNVNWDTARNAAQQLHREMIAFEQWLSPTRKEHECRKMVISLIRKAINSQWRDAEVHSFGSQDTELYLPQGDIDLVVVSDAMEYQRREGVLRAMAACLRRNNLATDVQVIARAKVPIIKFVCTHGRYRCDISVNQTNGLKAAEYVNHMQNDMPAIRPLIMLTKHLLQQRGMSEVYTGGLGSFSVILIVINFMQIHPKVQRGEIDSSRNLGVLFLDFLELYGKNFGYDDTGITVRGRGGYFHKARRGFKDHTKPWKLSIEDPQNPENDIATGSYNIISVRSALSGAFDMLTSAVCARGIEMARTPSSARVRVHNRFGDGRDQYDDVDEDAAARAELLSGNRAGSNKDKDPRSLLGTIIGVSRELLKARKDLLALYDSGVLQRLCGKPPPGRDPSPGPSSSRGSTSRSRPPSPKETPTPPPPPPPARSSSGVQSVRPGSGVQSIINIKGASAKESTPLKQQQRRTAQTSSSDEGEDSRYAATSTTTTQQRNNNGSKRIRRPKAYISEESESDHSRDDDDDRAPSGAISVDSSDSDSDSVDLADSDGGGNGDTARAARRQRPANGGGGSRTSRRQRQYWLDKAGVGRVEGDEDEDDYPYVDDDDEDEDE